MMAATSRRGAFLAIILACSAVAAAWETGTVKMHFAPGWEPHRAFGERGSGQPGPCRVGFYKLYAGAYPCKPCPSGTFAPEEGSTECHPCRSSKTEASINGSIFCSKELAAEPEQKGRLWGAAFQKVPNLMEYMMCLLANSTDCQLDAATALPGISPAAAPAKDGVMGQGDLMPGFAPISAPALAPAPEFLAPSGAAAASGLSQLSPAPSPFDDADEGVPAPSPFSGADEGVPAPSPIDALDEGVPAPSPFDDLEEGVPAPGPEAASGNGNRVVVPLLPFGGVPPEGAELVPGAIDYFGPDGGAPAPGPNDRTALAPALAPLDEGNGPSAEYIVAAVKTVAPEKLNARETQIKEDAIISVKAKPCQTEDSGSQRCGIPVGYKRNSRTGTVFFPANYANKPLPFMLLLHGSGWTGSDMINEFKEYAIKYDHAIIAPDSHTPLFWSSPDTAADPYTTDWYHIQACWDAVMKMPGVKANPAYLTAFGNSRASYAAVAFASRSTVDFNSAAILHASALANQMGPRSFPILWVTGTLDPLYGPSAAEPDVEKFRQERPDFPIKWEKWIDNHTIRNFTQIEGMVTWWLEPETRGRVIKTY